jgi:hypothetical protein
LVILILLIVYFLLLVEFQMSKEWIYKLQELILVNEMECMWTNIFRLQTLMFIRLEIALRELVQKMRQN